MAIPDFQSIMLPLLRFCDDGSEHTNREALDSLATEFGLTEARLGCVGPANNK